jgi:acyl-CoA reductase-like NAD-dependent aldehyde dehydrogenase
MTVLRKKLMATAVIAALAAGPGLAMAAGSAADNNSDVSIEQVQEKLSKAFDSVSEYTVDQRDEAVESTGEALAEIDEEIEALEARTRENWADMKEETRTTTTKAMNEVRAQRNTLAEKFGALKEGGDSAWEDVKGGFANAWKDLKSAWKDADKSSRSD